jgi:nitrite reductase (NADH) large subunit
MEYVIIGTGAAGIKAAETIREIDLECGITLISEEKESFYIRPALIEYAIGKVDKNQLVKNESKVFGNKNIKVSRGKKVVSLNTAEQSEFQ